MTAGLSQVRPPGGQETRLPRRFTHAEWRLLSTNAVDRLGAGLLLTSSTVYFTVLLGLPVTAVGLALTLAGAVGMLTATPIGMLADRRSTRRTLVILYVVRGIATLGYIWAGNWTELVLVVTCRVVADQPMSSLTQALVAELASGGRRIRLMATLRITSNISTALIGPVAGLAVAAGSRGAFNLLLVGNALAYFAAAALVPAPHGQPIRVPRDRGTAPGLLRDRRLLGFTLLEGVLTLWQPILVIGLPLWIVGHTHAPALAVGLVSAVNAVLCIALQLPASRVGRQPRAAMGCYAVAAALLSAACLTLAASGMVSGRAAALLWLVVGACVLTFAELLQVSAGWTVSYAIAPPEQ